MRHPRDIEINEVQQDVWNNPEKDFCIDRSGGFNFKELEIDSKVKANMPRQGMPSLKKVKLKDGPFELNKINSFALKKMKKNNINKFLF